MLKAALAYARRGVPVFPCELGAKRPLTRNGHWDATKDPHAIGRWWKRWPSANVGVPTGKESGIVVLDVDVTTGGPESLAKLEVRVFRSRRQRGRTPAEAGSTSTSVTRRARRSATARGCSVRGST